MLRISLLLLLLLPLFLAAADLEEQKEAARRLLKASLEAPNANVQEIIQDAKEKYANLLTSDELLELVMECVAPPDGQQRQDDTQPDDDSKKNNPPTVTPSNNKTYSDRLSHVLHDLFNVLMALFGQ